MWGLVVPPDIGSLSFALARKMDCSSDVGDGLASCNLDWEGLRIIAPSEVSWPRILNSSSIRPESLPTADDRSPA